MRTSEAEKPYVILHAGSFGQAIRHYRTKAGLTQGELAEECGVSRTYLSRLENGSGTEQVRRILAVLAELGVRATLERRGQ